MTDSAHLSSGVLAAVLGAAALHALWNSLVKSASDKFLSSAIVALWCGVAAVLAALVLPRPAEAAMPFIIASALIHIVYFILVGQLYRTADLSVAYPIMRGLAPLIAAIIALVTLGEMPPPIASLGVLALVTGVLAMGASGLAHGRIDRQTVIVALANSAVIAIYSVIDGEGARLSGAGSAFAFAYNSWADALTALAYLPIILFLRGRGRSCRLCGRLVARSDRRPRRLFRLRDRHLGDDARPDRRRRRAPRDVGRVCGHHRNRGARRAVPQATRGCGACHSRRHHPPALRLIDRPSSLLGALPLKIDIAARAYRVENRPIRIGDSVKLVGFERPAGLASLQETERLNLAKALLHEQVEMAIRFAEREAGRGEQRFGGCGSNIHRMRCSGCTTGSAGSP